MASIEQRGDAYRVHWRLGGKRTGPVQSCTFSGPTGIARRSAELAKQAAEARRHDVTREDVYAAVRVALGGPAPTTPGMPTLTDWFAEWIKLREEAGEIQPDTIAEYRRIFNRRISPFPVGRAYLTDIDRDAIAEWVTDVRKLDGRRKGQPISAQTVRHTHALLHQILGGAVPKWLDVNPAARPLGRRANAVGLPKRELFDAVFLEPWEVALIQANCSPAIRDLMFVAVRTGLRLGELLALQVDHVILDGRRPLIRVRRALKADGSVGEPKSEASKREVDINEETAAALAPRLTGKRRKDLVFPAAGAGRRGRPDDLMWRKNNLNRRHWLPAVAAAQRCPDHMPEAPAKGRTGPTRKLRVDEVSTCGCKGVLRRAPRFHDLRHTHVSLLIETREWTPKMIQLRVGHASFLTTMDIYGHLWERGNKSGLSKMERLLAMADDEDD